MCEKACPIIDRESSVRKKNYRSIYAGRLKDAKELHLSSSGGAFYALAKSIIEKNGVVVGAEYSENCEVVHGIATTLDECCRFRGSKYVQSNILGLYPKIKELLRSGQYVLFTGTPCQVHGLKLYLRKDYENLFTMDLVCHAVPSPLIFKEYKELVERKRGGKRLMAINMRDKEVREWLEPYSNRFLFEYGEEEVDPKGIVGWNNILFTRLIDRPSCHRCRFANFDRVGDITVADFWDYGNKRPDLRDDRGTSLVITNSEKGDALIDAIKNDFDIFQVTEDESRQRNLTEPTKEASNRTEFWNYYYKHGFEKSYEKFFVPGLIDRIKMIKSFVVRKLKNI